MARGIDFVGVNLVINYDFPQTVQSYIHRIGRTGRAGRSGDAVTYFTKQDVVYLKSIVNVMRGVSVRKFALQSRDRCNAIMVYIESGCEVPDWMLQLKRPRYAEMCCLLSAEANLVSNMEH